MKHRSTWYNCLTLSNYRQEGFMGRRRIGEIMVDEGFITDEQLEQALKDQKKDIERLGETVIRLNFITRIQRDEIVKIQMEEMAG